VKRKRFSVEHIVAVLKQAEWDTPVADPIRHLGIGSASAYTYGPEFIARKLRHWLNVLEVAQLYIEPGSPWENG